MELSEPFVDSQNVAGATEEWRNTLRSIGIAGNLTFAELAVSTQAALAQEVTSTSSETPL
jgi:hypothetical protein